MNGTKVVILSKNKKYFDVYSSTEFINMIKYLYDNYKILFLIDTVYNNVEIWFANCSKRKLYKAIMDYNERN